MKKDKDREYVPDRGRERFVAELALRVREERKVNSMTQAELALMAGVGRRFISELENEKQSLRLAEVLDVLEVLGLRLNLERRGGKQ